MSEERNDISPRRRRTRTTETGETSAAAIGSSSAGAESAAKRSGDMTQTQGPYSRVPEEARRMSASPYGAVNAAAVRQASADQAAFRERMTARHSVRPVRTDAGRKAYQNPARNTSAEPMSRVRVGYAPGRMNEGRPNRDLAGEPIRTPVYPNARAQASARPAPAQPVSVRPASVRPVPEASKPQTERRKGTLLYILASLLIAAGAFLTVVLMLPKENGLRQQVSGLAGKIPGIRAMADTEPSGQADAEQASADGTSDEGDRFASTDDLNMLLGISTATETGQAENLPDEPADRTLPGDPEGAAEQTGEAIPSEPETTDPPEMTASAQTAGRELPVSGSEPEEQPEEPEEQPEEQPEEEPDEISDAGQEPDATTDTVPGAAQETVTAAASEQESESVPSDEPDRDSGPEPVTPLSAEAVPAASPNLIKTVNVYSGKKQIKEYTRAAKDLIHMPSGWDYSKKQIGVLTFRGNAFRTNGAVGTVESAEALSQLWSADSGSAKGSNQTYYGTGWPGQPAIVKWSTQIQENSNIYEKKRTKEALKEVVVAGLDGVIRFLDLETGELTRNSIKLGFPMRGTPSLHPSGYPYMSVGQYARKMKSGTGTIGLRQYNMYNGNEIKPLIDGTDKSMGRAYNSTGSFETSALIDRVSDTAIVAGSNGLLYLIDLDSDFDWLAAIYKTKQSVIVMRSKTNGQKNEMTAIESSPAMYDKYVFYADMGGILRCVNTDFLSPVWAVDTKDAVMAAIALDMRTPDRLDLYTGNMLKNRKKGNNVQIRRYDAMTGKELWCVDIGVKKEKKETTDPGCKASPVIGENSLAGLVYFTVTGLSDVGRSKLEIEGDAKAALVALEKDTGKISWAYGLSDKSESSPIAVYDDDGNGWIIQCAWDGSIVMVDGLSGEPVASMKVKGNIEASPAAYNDIMVVGTTGKGTEKIYGIKIGTPPETPANPQ